MAESKKKARETKWCIKEFDWSDFAAESKSVIERKEYFPRINI